MGRNNYGTLRRYEREEEEYKRGEIGGVPN